MAKILIVEDDPLICEMYHTAFEFDGYEVDTAADGKEGLNKIKKWQPSMILLDIMMPNMNGLEVLDAMKSDETIKDIPVIVLTNLSTREDAELALTKGAVKYIIKAEHSPKEITEMVKEILSNYTRGEVPQPYSADKK